MGVPNFRVANGGPILGVPNGGLHYEGSQWVSPLRGSQLGVPILGVPNGGPILGVTNGGAQ